MAFLFRFGVFFVETRQMYNIHQTLMDHFGGGELSHYLRLPVGTRSENARIWAEIKTHWIRPGTPECYTTDSMTNLT